MKSLAKKCYFFGRYGMNNVESCLFGVSSLFYVKLFAGGMIAKSLKRLGTSYLSSTGLKHGLENIYWIGHRGEGPSHAGQRRTVCILS